MQLMKLEWIDADGNSRALSIAAGQAHVGHLVEVLLGAMADNVRITRQDGSWVRQDAQAKERHG